MDNREIKITCPECNSQIEIEIDKILHQQIEGEIRQEYIKKQRDEENRIEEERIKLDQEKQNLQKTIQETVNQQLVSEKQSLTEKLKKEIESENSQKFESVQKELNDKSEQLKDYHKKTAEIEKLKRDKKELKDKIEAEAQQKLSEVLALEKEKIQKTEQEKNELEIREKDEIIKQLSVQITEAKRKADQGSQQLQGEVQELAIEEFLRNTFPLDTIEEIKKGRRGADCIQIVNAEHRQNCGSICYESKRTKNFQNSWIEKLKDDMREKQASFGVLVTETMPEGIDILGQIKNIWVCSFKGFKGLSHVLRETIILISDATVSQKDKGTKMSQIYDYFTGDEFKNNIKDIAEAFIDMQEDLVKEKRAMNRLWKKREKQTQKVLSNLNLMFGSIQGIAGNSIGNIKKLELPGADEMESDEDIIEEK